MHSFCALTYSTPNSIQGSRSSTELQGVGLMNRPLPQRTPSQCSFQACWQTPVPAWCSARSLQPAAAFGSPQSPREALATVFIFPLALFGFLLSFVFCAFPERHVGGKWFAWNLPVSAAVLLSLGLFWSPSLGHLSPILIHLGRTSSRFCFVFFFNYSIINSFHAFSTF